MTRIVLIGAGHTHLHILEEWTKHPIADAELTLISANRFSTYSGMMPGVIAGQYELNEAQVDLSPLCEQATVRWIESAVKVLDPKGKKIELSNGDSVSFDVASVGIGSIPAGREIWQEHPHIVPVKPLDSFLSRLYRVLSSVGTKERRPQIGIVGGGAAGVEIAFCLQTRLQNENSNAEILLLESGAEILPGFRSRTRSVVRKGLDRRNIQVFTEHRVTGMSDEAVQFKNQSDKPCDCLIWVAGASPPPALEKFDLPKDNRGFLAVRKTLQSTADLPVFAVGDSATCLENPHPKAGVYAVRQGPILWDNLNRMLNGKPLKDFEPQRDFLRLLNLGNGTAVAQYKFLSGKHRWFWNLKDHIDRKFLKRFQSS